MHGKKLVKEIMPKKILYCKDLLINLLKGIDFP